MSHRLFFGLRPPAPIRDALSDIMAGIDNARWQDDDQLHLTMRYIGEVDTHQADDIAEAAGSLQFDPFDLTIRGLGHFDRKGVPNAVWAAIEPSEPLARLHNKIERLVQQAGCPAETRKFTPHITLARLNSSSGCLAPFLAKHSGLSLPAWRVDDFVLYESFLRPEGSLYREAVTYPLR